MLPCCSHGALPGHTSVPHQRVAVGQLRTLKEGPRTNSRSRPTSSPATPPGLGSSSSSNPLASGPSSTLGRQHVQLAVEEAQEASPLLTLGGSSSHDSSKGGDAGAESVLQREQPALQLGSLTTKQMLCSGNFWLLFAQFMVAAGVCLAYLNNLGQLVVSLGGGHDGHVVFVSLFSVANAGGKRAAGPTGARGGVFGCGWWIVPALVDKCPARQLPLVPATRQPWHAQLPSVKSPCTDPSKSPCTGPSV